MSGKPNFVIKKKASEEEKVEIKQGTPNPSHLDGVPDMCSLIYMEEGNIVHNLKCRYKQQQIYTYMSAILLAVNPYEHVPLYGEEKMEEYRGARRHQLMQLDPHCYAMGENAYQLMTKVGRNQSMVICGESGSGKTETAKVFMRYLAHVTGEDEAAGDADSSALSIEQQFLEANPILEAFGNAQTVMNNNSSRFGKFTKVMFDAAGGEDSRPKIIGSFIETYLLEKSRVVHQNRGERNYHIFYQIIRGMPEERMAEWKVQDMAHFHYMNQSGHYDIPGVSDQKNFERVKSAFSNLHVDAADQEQIYSAVAGILHLGNCSIDDSDEDQAALEAEAEESLTMAALLLQVDKERLRTRLVTRTRKVGVQKIVSPLTPEQAVYNRDSIAKALFNGLFNYVVTRLNDALFKGDAVESPRWIGILDVFGFEESGVDNSFEQFCINYANERLQQFFNDNVISAEQDEYLREALPWEPLEFEDNQDMIDLIEGKPNGIIAILDTTCVMPKGSDQIFVQNLFEAVGRKHKRIKEERTRPKKKGKKGAGAKPAPRRGREAFSGFTLTHYAGRVTYNSVGFLDKNNDSSDGDTVELFTASDSPIVAKVLEPPAGAKKKRRNFASLGAMFSKQLVKLLTTLRETQPHFVRCLNPNQFKQPATFDPEHIVPQLRCGGLIEAIRILKLGFPSRVPYAEIHERYGHVLPIEVQAKDFTEALFLAFGLEESEYQLGLTKVFFKPGKQQFLEDVLKNPELPPEKIAEIRSVLARKRFSRAKAAVLAVVRFQGWVAKHRARGRLIDAVATAATIRKSLAAPLERVQKRGAARALQSVVRTHFAQRAMSVKKATVPTLQRYLRHVARRVNLTAEIKARCDATFEKSSKAATVLQQYLRHVNRRKALTAEIDRRVEATAERIRQQEAMEQAKREEEERERLRKLEEERLRAEREEAERKRREEERKRKEEEERLKREEEERIRREKEEEERRRREEEERARREEEERARREKEEAERLQREEEERQRQAEEEAERARIAAEEAERQRKEEERKRKEAEFKARIAAEKKEREEAARLEREEREREAAEREAAEAERRRKEREAQLAANREAAAAAGGDGADDDGAAAAPVNKPAPPATPPPTHILLKYHRFTPEEEAEFMRKMLLEGAKFLKYGKRGKPHIKHVCLNVLGNLHWADRAMDPSQLRPSESFIKLGEVTAVLAGKQTAVFKRSVAARSPGNLCFSIVTPDRTLDLQAIAGEQRDMWVKALQSAVRDCRRGVTDFVQGTTAGDAKPEPVQKDIIEEEDDVNDTLDHEELVARGEQLVKFGRQGKPKERYVNCDMTHMYWGAFPQPSSTTGASNIDLNNVTSVAKGKTTEVFHRKVAEGVDENLCFSVITKDRTVDLQTRTPERRDQWVAALEDIIKQAKDYAQADWLSRKRQESVAVRRAITGTAATRAAAQKPEIAYDPDTMPMSRLRSGTLPPDASESELAASGAAVGYGGAANFKSVIRSMARRGSVELMAANMARNMARQAMLQGPGSDSDDSDSDNEVPQVYESHAAAAAAAAAAAEASSDAAPSAALAARRQEMAEQEAALNAEEVEDHMTLVEQGDKFVKHGRLGKPKAKYINVLGGKLFWDSHPNPAASVDSSFIYLADVTEIRPGKTTEVFARKTASSVHADLCFSLILKNRTLDLQAVNIDHRDLWVLALETAMAHAKRAAHDKWISRKRAQSRGRRPSVTGTYYDTGDLPVHVVKKLEAQKAAQQHASDV